MRKISYTDYIRSVRQRMLSLATLRNVYPTCIPNWDNTPRTGMSGLVLTGSSPSLYLSHLKDSINMVNRRPPDEQLVFIKSWNEWAEGNYLEPDNEFGYEYLKATLHSLIS